MLSIKEQRKRAASNCLTDCVAYLFNIHPERVPYFVGNRFWVKSLLRFFKRRGYDIDYEPYDKTMPLNSRMYYLVTGKSWRGKNIRHAVIYRGHKPHYDPHASKRFLRGQPEYVWRIYKSNTK